MPRRSQRRPAWFNSVLGSVCLAATHTPAAQDSCVAAPLFSGDVVGAMLYPASASPSHTLPFAMGDADNDDHLDIVRGPDYSGLIYFRGTGRWWEFDPSVIVPLPQVPTSSQRRFAEFAFADLNSDGHLDLVTWDWSRIRPLRKRLHVMLEFGDGTFGHPIVYSPHSSAILWEAKSGTFPTTSLVGLGPTLSIHHDTDAGADLLPLPPAPSARTQFQTLLWKGAGVGAAGALVRFLSRLRKRPRAIKAVVQRIMVEICGGAAVGAFVAVPLGGLLENAAVRTFVEFACGVAWRRVLKRLRASVLRLLKHALAKI
jgi:hypothetical protein